MTFGTSSVRESSDFFTSTARPRFTCSWCTTAGLPSAIAKPALSAGIFSIARTTAKAMRCVKLTFPPPLRARWLFRIWRFTSSRRAGTVRTEVAVGTPRLASMFTTVRAAAPRSGSGASPSAVGALAAGAGVAAAGAGAGDDAGAGAGAGAGAAAGRAAEPLPSEAPSGL